MIDLAGSECGNGAPRGSVRARESALINRSLLSLELLVRQLSAKSRYVSSPHLNPI
jgi:hypothetical protein